jgi:hypothetical protein
MEQETFWTLLHNSAHWEFELFLFFLDASIGGLFYRFVVQRIIKKWKKHHKGDDDQLLMLTAKVNYLMLLMSEQGMVKRSIDNTSVEMRTCHVCQRTFATHADLVRHSKEGRCSDGDPQRGEPWSRI